MYVLVNYWPASMYIINGRSVQFLVEKPLTYIVVVVRGKAVMESGIVLTHSRYVGSHLDFHRI